MEIVAVAVVILATGIIGWFLIGGTLKKSSSEILAYAQNAGFTSDDAITATAIALAESGGNPNAYNPEMQAGTPTGLGSYGLWQIYEKAHPELAGLDLTDPQQNANAAYIVFREQGFNAWSTYKNQDYIKFLSEVPS